MYIGKTKQYTDLLNIDFLICFIIRGKYKSYVKVN